MSQSCQTKQKELVSRFQSCSDDRERYKLIIALGRSITPISPPEVKVENLVRGCQSQTFLHARTEGDVIHFEAQSDALISSGLTAMLLMVYSGESAETILTCPPDFVQELQLTRYLTPNRSNGLFAVHLRMKQDALQAIAQKRE